MPKKEKKETMLVHVNIEKKLGERLEKYCHKEERTKTYVIEHALADFLDKNNVK